MTIEKYLEYHEQIINQNTEERTAPYDDAAFYDYTVMNWQRTSRWLKTGKILPEMESVLQNRSKKMNWLLITEPWCGDAAHIVPFIKLIADASSNINLTVELRDAEPNSIYNYLTGKSKSIPILVMRDEAQKDIAVWGPRPKECQIVYNELHDQNADLEALKIALQKWYNADKGVSMQKELIAILEKV